jgi:two-component sensor histidine kinase
MVSRRYDGILRLGRAASDASDLDDLLQRTVEIVASVLDRSLLMILHHDPDTDLLVGRAGIGWRTDIGALRLDAGAGSPDGHALRYGSLTVSRAATDDGYFRTPRLFAIHGIARCLSVVIPGDMRAFGMLKVADSEAGTYATEDVEFVQAVAAMLGLAIRQRLAASERQTLSAQYEDLRLRQAAIAADASVRTRSSLELVQTALGAQMQQFADDTRPVWMQEHLDRIATIATISAPSVETDAAGMLNVPDYLASLTASLRAELGGSPSPRDLTLDADAAYWPPRRAYALGLILVELVTICARSGGGALHCQFAIERRTATARLIVADDALPVSVVADMGQHAPIGLRIIWALLQRHGGGLQIDSGFPHGARFVAVFPSAAADDPHTDYPPPIIETRSHDDAWQT